MCGGAIEELPNKNHMSYTLKHLRVHAFLVCAQGARIDLKAARPNNWLTVCTACQQLASVA